MGTETSLPHSMISKLSIYSVKLNNPLMGTETELCELLTNRLGNVFVKLNNPLMGTETCYRLVRLMV